MGGAFVSEEREPAAGRRQGDPQQRRELLRRHGCLRLKRRTHHLDVQVGALDVTSTQLPSVAGRAVASGEDGALPALYAECRFDQEPWLIRVPFSVFAFNATNDAFEVAPCQSMNASVMSASTVFRAGYAHVE